MPPGDPTDASAANGVSLGTGTRVTLTPEDCEAINEQCAAVKMAVPNVADRASAYAMPGVAVDGNDLAAVVAAARPAVARARSGGGPTLVECKTYRLRGHSKSDRNLYRTKEEIETWRENDAIRRLEKELLAQDRFAEAELRAIEQAAQQTIDSALEFAKASPDPEPSDLTRDVYAE